MAAAKALAKDPHRTYKDVLEEAGYSKWTARSASHNIIGSIGFKEAFKTLVPDWRLAVEQQRLLNTFETKKTKFDLEMTEEDIQKFVELEDGENLVIITKKDKNGKPLHYMAYYAVPLNSMRKDTAELSYKLRGEFAPEKVINVDPIREMTDEELESQLEAVELEQKKRLK